MSRARKASAPVAITLAGDLTIAAAAEQRDAMLHLVSDGSDHAIDLTAVEELDTAGLQLLVALTREIDRRGRLVSVSCSDPVAEVLAAAGLGTDLRPAALQELTS